MASISEHVEASVAAWTVLPMPLANVPIPQNALDSVSDDALVNAPPHLVATLLRAQANGGLQVLSPRAVPMSAQIHRVDPIARQPDLIVVSTNASASTVWPTVDGRSVDALFPGEPARADGNDASIVVPTASRPVGSAFGGMRTADPISKALARAANLIDIQRRPDVGGDADVLAELLDSAWGLQRGTFAGFAGVMLNGDADLLRTAIDPDTRTPDALLPTHIGRVVSVAGGYSVRSDYGDEVAIDWARQRAVAKTRYCRSMRLEGLSFMPDALTWKAGDITAPLHSTLRHKHLVFQPNYGCTFYVGAETFTVRVVIDPQGPFAACDGMANRQDLAGALDDPRVAVEMLESLLMSTAKDALPRAAMRSVAEAVVSATANIATAISEAPVRHVEARRLSTAVVQHVPGSALAAAVAEILQVSRGGFARGYCAHRVARGAIMKVLEGLNMKDLARGLMLVKMVREHMSLLGAPVLTQALLNALAGRTCGALGSLVAASVTVESERQTSNAGDWWLTALEVMPAHLRPTAMTPMGWAKFVVYCMWAEINAKWTGAMAGVRRAWVKALVQPPVAVGDMPLHQGVEARAVAAIRAQIHANKCSTCAYYDAMMDCYKVMAVGLREAQKGAPMEDRAALERGLDVAMLGAVTWQFRANALRSVSYQQLPVGEGVTHPAHRRLQTRYTNGQLVVAPYSQYMNMRKLIAASKVDTIPLPERTQGNVSQMLRSLPPRLVTNTADFATDGALHALTGSRIMRYVQSLPALGIALEASINDLHTDVALAAAQAEGTVRAMRERSAALTVQRAARRRSIGQATHGVPASAGAELDLPLPANADGMMILLAAPAAPGTQWPSGYTHSACWGYEQADVIDELSDKMGEEAAQAFLAARYETATTFNAAAEEVLTGLAATAVATSGTTAAIADA